MKAVIMAGGSGTRLWPLSTKLMPKQFQPLASDRTMLQESLDRLHKEFAYEDIYIATNEQYVDLVKEQLPDIPVGNIIAETALRDTASAVALISTLVHADDPDAIVAVFPSDHVIQNDDVLLAGVRAAHLFIAENLSHILTFGIMPHQPEVGYGYIKKAEPLSGVGEDTIYRAEKFVEKPDAETAQKYLDDGHYYWNAGMFVFHAGEMLKKYKAYVPDTYARIVAIQEVIGHKDYESVLREQYAQMDKISVDYAIMENVQDIAVLPLALRWSDVGNWVALKETLVADKDLHLSSGEHVDFHSTNAIVFGQKKPIITVGLKDVIVIDTPDALLVCSHDEAANLSKYVKEMGAGDYEHLL